LLPFSSSPEIESLEKAEMLCNNHNGAHMSELFSRRRLTSRAPARSVSVSRDPRQIERPRYDQDGCEHCFASFPVRFSHAEEPRVDGANFHYLDNSRLIFAWELREKTSSDAIREQHLNFKLKNMLEEGRKAWNQRSRIHSHVESSCVLVDKALLLPSLQTDIAHIAPNNLSLLFFIASIGFALERFCR
jgi:hypothetical protein